MTDLLARRRYLTSGTKALDGMLGGSGFETQKVYEIYGPEGAGKSNLLHQLICTALLPPEKGGLGAGTIYIDTDGSFSCKRVQQLAQRFGIDPQQAQEQIIVSHPPTSDVLLYLCEFEVERLALQEKARLICLDSLASLFRSGFGDERLLFPERNHKVARVVQALRRAACNVNGVFVLTNQVEENLTGMGRPWRFWGYSWYQDTQVRIMMCVRNTAEGLRLLKMEKAIDIPPLECILKLDSDGFSDCEPPKRRKLTSTEYTVTSSGESNGIIAPD